MYMLLTETDTNLKSDTKSSPDRQDLDKSPPKKKWSLPWNLDKTNSDTYEEESTEVDEVEPEDTSETEEELRKPFTFTAVDDKFVRRITPKQRQALESQKNSPAISKSVSTNSSMESIFQPIVTPTSTKRKRLDDSDMEPGMTRKKPPSRLQLELGYDGSRFQEWNSLRVRIHANSIFWLYILTLA